MQTMISWEIAEMFQSELFFLFQCFVASLLGTVCSISHFF